MTPDMLGVVRSSGGRNMDNFIALHELNHFQNYHTIDLDMSQIQVLQNNMNNNIGFKNAMGLEAKRAPVMATAIIPDLVPKMADASSSTKDAHIIASRLSQPKWKN